LKGTVPEKEDFDRSSPAREPPSGGKGHGAFPSSSGEERDVLSFRVSGEEPIAREMSEMA
jgi:hypothetical protein